MYKKRITTKAKSLSHKGVDYAIDALSKDLLEKAFDKIRPKGGSLYQRSSGIPIPFPFVDWKKGWQVISDRDLFKGQEASTEELKDMVARYKHQYKIYKDQGGLRSYG